MTAIQERIQPKFKKIGEALTEDVRAMVGSDMHLHIAKHARRTVNPPNDTWMAIAGNKRGYKKHPHFQVGLWDDHLFIRSEEHTSELQSRGHLVCRLLLE